MIVLADDTQDEQDLRDAAPTALERFARLTGAAGLLLLLAAAWLPLLGSAAQSSAKEIRILPRLSVFICTLLLAHLLAGARWTRWQSLGAALLFGGLAVSLHTQLSAVSHAFLPAQAALLLAAQTLALLFAGFTLGDRIQSGGALLQFLAAAIAGDIWLQAFSVADNAAPESLLTLLRLTWPPPQGHLAQAPGAVEIVVCGALAGCAKRLGLPLISVTLGAFAGYSAASFLALPPWPAWPTLSVLLLTSGTLIGCWPDLDLRLTDLRRAFLTGGLLLLILAGFSAARHRLADPPPPEPEPFKYRPFT